MSLFKISKKIKKINKYMIPDRFKNIFIDPSKCSGQYLWDAKNSRKILDLSGFFGSSPVRFGHPELRPEKFPNPEFNPSNSDFYTPGLYVFLKRFSRLFMKSSQFRHSFFVSGGSLGVENALKAAFDWKLKMNKKLGISPSLTPEDLQIVHFSGAFHGRSGYALSLTNTTPEKTEGFPKFTWPRFDFPEVKYPGSGNSRALLEPVVMAEMNSYFNRNSDRIAAIIIEPIQGEGGDRYMSPGFWKFLHDLANGFNVLLIADEVQTGCFTTGTPWAWQGFSEKISGFQEKIPGFAGNLSPDLVVFGKKFQNSGVIAGSRLDLVEDNVFRIPSRINSTFGGNYQDFLRGAQYLKIIEQEKLWDNCRKMGKYIISELKDIKGITNVRGQGLMIAFDMPNRMERDMLISKLLDNGIIVLPSGSLSIRIRPKLDIEKHVIDYFSAILNLIIKQSYR